MSSLRQRPLRDLFKRAFKGKKPPISATLSEKEVWRERINDLLQGRTYITVWELTSYYSYRGNQWLVIRFYVDDPRSSRHMYEIKISEDEQLVIAGHMEVLPIASLDELTEFILTGQERAEYYQAQYNKQKRLNDFRHQAIMAQVKQLAHEYQFLYTTETSSQNLKLFIKISEQDSAKFLIPLKTFQQALPHLRETIEGLMLLRKAGLRVRIAQRQYRWDNKQT